MRNTTTDNNKKIRQQKTNWCFTINNHTEHLIDEIIESMVAEGEPRIAYIAMSEEVGKNGTPHLQGFMQLRRKGMDTSSVWS